MCAQNVEPLLRTALPEVHHAAVPEVAVYLRESCGNATRIDYGTGSNEQFNRESHKIKSTCTLYMYMYTMSSVCLHVRTALLFLGHELSFLAFLCCLYKISALAEEDAAATVLTLFYR